MMVRIGIIGGGFSGGILALHLLRQGSAKDEIVVIEDRETLGLGQAYSTRMPWHLLNVTAGGMSPFPDQPDAFVAFLADQPDLPSEEGPLPERFVPRLFYGRFLAREIEKAKEKPFRPRFSHVRNRAIALHQKSATKKEILFADGSMLSVDRVVLALGNLPPGRPHAIAPLLAPLLAAGRYIGDPWAGDAIAAIPPQAHVLLLGTGLTMVDSVLSLVARGHQGQIAAVSRHGLLPRPHVERPGAVWAPFADPLKVKSARVLFSLVRDQVGAAETMGVPWQAVLNSLRASTQDLWRALPEREQRRFIRHVRPWWDVHRHRIAPCNWREIEALIAAGQLTVKAGRIGSIAQAGDSAEAEFRPRGQPRTQRLSFDWLINCSGPNYDFAASDQPLLQHMLKEGQIRLNTHRLGVDVDPRFALIDRNGKSNGDVYAMGPMLRGAYWEINGVPDIARQAKLLAMSLLADSQPESIPRPQRSVPAGHNPSSCSRVLSMTADMNETAYDVGERLPFVDSRIYSDEMIFEEELDKIWKRVWLLAVHESELPEPLDFRTMTVAREPIAIVRGTDNRIRAFLNVCPHRGNLILRAPSGSLAAAEPSGGPNHMTCMFHAWQFDCFGSCVSIPRQQAGYQDRLDKKNADLTELRCEVAYGGFVWLSLDPDAGPLSEFIGHAFDAMKEELDTEPLAIFHYHKAIIPSNYKLWHDTNSEFYHDYMHYFNRATSMAQKGYFDRHYSAFPNGHCTVGSMEVKYEAYAGAADRVLSFPGMPRNGWKMVDLFPGATYNIRGSSLRVDTMTPVGPDRVMIEFRGLGLKSDSPEDQAQRVRDHNTIWGPFGRNLHEDLLGITGQGIAMQKGAAPRRILHGRRENNSIHDEIGMRHFYKEWARRMGRSPSYPYPASPLAAE